MPKNFRWKAPLILGASAALVLTGCVAEAGTGDTNGEAKEPITIGVVMARTGFMASADTPPLNAMELEVERLNAEEGGIDGHPIVLDIVDTQTNFDEYASGATRVIDGGAKILVVTCDYDISAPAALVAEARNVLNFAPCVGDPLYGPAGGLNLGFSMGAGNPGEASIMAEFSHDKGFATAVLLTDTTLKYTQNQCAIFEKRFTELGGTVVSKYEYQQGDAVTETVSKIAAAGEPDVVVNCGYSPGGAQVVKDLRSGGVNSSIVTGFGNDGDFWADSVPGLKDHFTVTYATINGDDPDAAVNDFAAAYTTKYGSAPQTSSFIAGTSVIQAIKSAYLKAKSWDGDKLTAALETFKDEPLPIGNTTFGPDDHIDSTRALAVLEMVDGKIKWIEDRAPQKIVTVD